MPAERSAPRAWRFGGRRQRRILAAVAISLVGLAALAAAGFWVQRSRAARLRDTRDAVTASSLAAVPADAPELAFRDVADEVGVRMRHGAGKRGRILSEDTGSGLAWSDIDGDGDFDLYVVDFPTGAEAADGHNRLFRNDGRRFIDIAAASGTADPRGFGMGASFADVDDDGDADLHVTNRGPNRLFRNRGDGTFEEVASTLGVDDPRWSVGSAWGDFDRDGRLDLYVANYVELTAPIHDLAVRDPNWQGMPLALNPKAFDPQPNRLYRQLADGRFEDIALLAGASDPTGRSMAATAVDLDGDGWLDLYIANDVSPNVLLLNLGASQGGAVFEDLSTATGTADPRGSMGIAVTDLATASDGPDGLPDLFVSHWIAQENALYQALATAERRLEYRDRIRALGLGEISTPRVGWGCAFVDLDLDGRRDLVVANGSTLEVAPAPGGAADASSAAPRLEPQPMFLFWNAGERFVDLAPIAGPALGGAYVARGLAAADDDGDGDIDFAVSVNQGRPLLLRNDSALDHHWLAVRLSGPAAALFGARLELASGGRRQVLWWGADVSFASGHAPEALFGIGADAGPADLVVAWADGRRTEHRGLPVDRRLRVRHPAF